MRGLVMVIMALDHVRDYFHINALTSNNPEHLDTTTPILFFTRFITHYCAPVFIFLAGTSAYLYGQKCTKKELSKFLITRGIWLIIVEICITNTLWWFDPGFDFINLQVIWAIGVCMMLLGVFIYLPLRVILILGLLIILGHNMLDNIKVQGDGIGSIIWYILHQPGGFSIENGPSVRFAYSVLPWLGTMLLGFSFGQLYKKETTVVYRKKMLLYLGIGTILLFLTLRGFNIYGDPTHWTPQDATYKTIISFFKVSKYPASLTFLLITLGPALLFLYSIESVKNKVTDFLLVFGRVPFFYYILHVLFVHLGAIIGLLITGKDWRIMILSFENIMSGSLTDYGYALWIVYLVWITIVALLYPLCKWYMKYKAKNRDKKWLSYL